MNVSVEYISEDDFLSFINCSKFVSRFKDYRNWMEEMSKLRVFWARKGLNERYVGVKSGNKLVGVAQLLIVPFYERRNWGYSDEYRGEIREVYVDSFESLEAIIRFAEKYFNERKIRVFGVTVWNNWHWIEDLGFDVYARSVLICWDTKTIIRNYNKDVEFVFASRKDISILREIQKSSWGFFIPPSFKRQDVLIAIYNNIPVGCAYLNKSSANIDYGIHVKREYWRMGIGSAILRKALEYFRERGFKYAYVCRNFRSVFKINPTDKIALKFYIKNGGKIVREYRGYRRKKKKLNISPPCISKIIV